MVDYKCKYCSKAFDSEAKLRGHNISCRPKTKEKKETKPKVNAEMEVLIKAIYTLSRLCAPILFKYTSASGVSKEELAEMHNTLQKLHDKHF